MLRVKLDYDGPAPQEIYNPAPSSAGTLANMAVDQFAEALRSKNLEFVQEGQYSNRQGQIGSWAIYRDGQRYLWFSVSGTEIRLAPDEVAMAIQAPGRYIARAKPYKNGNGQQGFEATVHSGGHAFMLGAAPDPPRFF